MCGSVGCVCVLGANDDLRAPASLGVSADAWPSVRVTSVVYRGVHRRGQYWPVSECRLFYLATVSWYRCHIYCGRRFLLPGSGMSRNFRLFLFESRERAIYLRNLRTTTTPASPCTTTLFMIRFAQTLSTGVPWCLIRVSPPTFSGLEFRLWWLSSNPNFA